MGLRPEQRVGQADCLGRAPEEALGCPLKANVPKALPIVVLPEVLAKLILPVEAVKLLFTVKLLMLISALVAVRVPMTVSVSAAASPNQLEPSTSKLPAT